MAIPMKIANEEHDDHKEAEVKNRWPAQPGASAETAKIYDYLRGRETGEFIADAQVRADLALDVSVGGKNYHNLGTALKWLRREDGEDWQRVRNANGIQRLASKQTAATMTTHARRIRGESQRALERGRTVQMMELDDQEKSKHLVIMAQYGALHSQVDPQAIRQLQREQKTPDLKRMLDQLKK